MFLLTAFLEFISVNTTVLVQIVLVLGFHNFVRSYQTSDADPVSADERQHIQSIEEEVVLANVMSM